MIRNVAGFDHPNRTKPEKHLLYFLSCALVDAKIHHVSFRHIGKDKAHKNDDVHRIAIIGISVLDLLHNLVIPVKTGIQTTDVALWIPACA